MTESPGGHDWPPPSRDWHWQPAARVQLEVRVTVTSRATIIMMIIIIMMATVTDILSHRDCTVTVRGLV